MTKDATRLLLAAAVALVIPAHAGALERAIYLISQTSRGNAAEGRSEGPAVDGNGILTAYTSDALNLVSPPFTSFRDQIYLRDINEVTSDLISKAPDGKAGNRPSQPGGFAPGISADGRYIAFSSQATNLTPDDTNVFEDVFVRQRRHRRDPAHQPRHRRPGERRQQLRAPERRRPLRRLPVERQQPRRRRHQQSHRHLRLRPRRRHHAARQRQQRRRGRRRRQHHAGDQRRRPLRRLRVARQEPRLAAAGRRLRAGLRRRLADAVGAARVGQRPGTARQRHQLPARSDRRRRRGRLQVGSLQPGAERHQRRARRVRARSQREHHPARERRRLRQRVERPQRRPRHQRRRALRRLRLVRLQLRPRRRQRLQRRLRLRPLSRRTATRV